MAINYYFWRFIMKRVFNFSAGPAMLPLDVLKDIQNEILDYNNTGMSVMEMSHRSKPFEEILNKSISDLKELLNIPDNYRLFMLRGEQASSLQLFLLIL